MERVTAEMADAADAEAEEARQRELNEASERERRLASSFSIATLSPGTGKTAWRGARALVNVRGTFASSGETFEDSIARGEPLLLLLGRGDVVPGLDRALLQMRAGQRAAVTVQPGKSRKSRKSRTICVFTRHCPLFTPHCTPTPPIFSRSHCAPRCNSATLHLT